jgi:hypothetical protein
MICTKFNRNWLTGCGEEDFKKFRVFLNLCYYLPLEKGIGLQLNNSEFHLSMNDLRQLCLKLA